MITEFLGSLYSSLLKLNDQTASKNEAISDLPLNLQNPQYLELLKQQLAVSLKDKFSREESPKSKQSRDCRTGGPRKQNAPRRAWSTDLHRHFVSAWNTITQSGGSPSPKKLMVVMAQNGAPMADLTIRQVQSHHQKYKLKVQRKEQCLDSPVLDISSLKLRSLSESNLGWSIGRSMSMESTASDWSDISESAFDSNETSWGLDDALCQTVMSDGGLASDSLVESTGIESTDGLESDAADWSERIWLASASEHLGSPESLEQWGAGDCPSGDTASGNQASPQSDSSESSLSEPTSPDAPCAQSDGQQLYNSDSYLPHFRSLGLSSGLSVSISSSDSYVPSDSPLALSADGLPRFSFPGSDLASESWLSLGSSGSTWQLHSSNGSECLSPLNDLRHSSCPNLQRSPGFFDESASSTE